LHSAIFRVDWEIFAFLGYTEIWMRVGKSIGRGGLVNA